MGKPLKNQWSHAFWGHKAIKSHNMFARPSWGSWRRAFIVKEQQQGELIAYLRASQIGCH
jgi:hypothetical protein